MLRINRSLQHDGFTFSLDPLSVQELKLRKPDVRPLPRIFIAFDNLSDFQAQRGDLYDQVAQLITRLTEHEIEQLGGFMVVDPVTKEQVDA